MVSYVDWSDDNLGAAFNQPDLLVFNDNTDDWDMTEFQPTWRNQKFHSKDLPHWLGKFKGLNPSANLCGAANLKLFNESIILITSQSPKIDQFQSSEVIIYIYNSAGETMLIEKVIINTEKAYYFNIKE